MLPGFELDDRRVGKWLSFDCIRLEEYSSAHEPNNDRGVLYKTSSSCYDSLSETIEDYYEYKPEIEEWYSPGTTFGLRVYGDDAEVVASQLAADMVIEFQDPFTQESVADPLAYTDLVDIIDAQSLDIDWADLSDTQTNIEEKLDTETPDGLDTPTFSLNSYDEYLTEYISDPVRNANWSGGHAWLINLAIHELRNGRYTAAAYSFEGARHGLTKHTYWEETRIRGLLDNALLSLRNLCLANHGEDASLKEIELYTELENRDLIYYPQFISRPSFGDEYFRYSTKAWVANALLLVQAVAHAMEAPTISRTEIDPYGSNLTHRNVTFVLKVAQELIRQDDIDRQQEINQDPIQYLQRLDFTSYAPEITVTRILNDSDYSIMSYGMDTLQISGSQEIEYDILVELDNQHYVVRALRVEDYEPEKIKSLEQKVSQSEFKAIFLYDSELNSPTTETFADNETLSGYYVDLVRERMQPVSAGFPRSFEDLSTEEEIQTRLKDLYQAAETADSTKEKGDTLEELMELIFQRAIPDTEVRDTNTRTRVEEIDLQLHNKCRRFPWDDLGTRVLVECKNWSKTAGVDVIYTVFGKAQMISPNCKGAILVAWEGISDSVEDRNGDQLIREIRQKNVNILVLDKNDLKRISETGDAQSVFEEKADELWSR